MRRAGVEGEPFLAAPGQRASDGGHAVVQGQRLPGARRCVVAGRQDLHPRGPHVDLDHGAAEQVVADDACDADGRAVQPEGGRHFQVSGVLDPEGPEFEGSALSEGGFRRAVPTVDHGVTEYGEAERVGHVFRQAHGGGAAVEHEPADLGAVDFRPDEQVAPSVHAPDRDVTRNGRVEGEIGRFPAGSAEQSRVRGRADLHRIDQDRGAPRRLCPHQATGADPAAIIAIFLETDRLPAVVAAAVDEDRKMGGGVDREPGPATVIGARQLEDLAERVAARWFCAQRAGLFEPVASQDPRGEARALGLPGAGGPRHPGRIDHPPLSPVISEGFPKRTGGPLYEATRRVDAEGPGHGEVAVQEAAAQPQRHRGRQL